MKKTLSIFLAAFISALKLTAQGPTLTQANTTPVVGETFQSQYAKSANVDVKSGGANQTWDYTNIIDSGTAFYLQAVTPASTPFADSFPTSNLVVKTADDSAYIFFNSQSSSLYEVGLALIDSGIIRYTKPKIYLPYPFSYGSFFTDSVVEQIPGVNVIFRGKDTVTGDGYGTLKTPGFMYTNVLRVLYKENFTYSKDTLNTKTTIKEYNTNYLYFTPNTHFPLMSVTQTESITKITVFGISISDTTYSKNVSYLTKVILPLSFVSFNASLNKEQVLLQWQTAQETNTNHFNVQRSLRGTSFTDIAEVKATGNSSAISQYNYTDQDFAKAGVPSTVFYRIKETDNDGKQFYSSTTVVHGNTNVVSLYPNPARNYIYFNVTSSTSADAVSIYNAKGVLVKQYLNYQLNQPINISMLSEGTYFIQVKTKDKTITTSIVKE